MNSQNSTSFLSVFSCFSVPDIAQAKSFYSHILGLTVEQDNMGLHLQLPGGAEIFVYEKGVRFIHYPELKWPQDEHRVLRGLAAGMGPDISWFNDPAGNVMAILQIQ